MDSLAKELVELKLFSNGLPTAAMGNKCCGHAGYILRGHGLEQLPGTERDDTSARNDDVIEDADAEELPGLDKTLRDRDVLLAGLGIAGWVIVNEHD